MKESTLKLQDKTMPNVFHLPHRSRENCLASMRKVAGTHARALEVIDFMEKTSVEVKLEQLKDPPLEFTKEHFEKHKNEMAQRARQLGIEMPQSFDEIKEQLGDLHNVAMPVPSFTIKFPDDWTGELLGMCPISPDMHQFYLPGQNLMGYHDNIVLNYGEKPNIESRFIAYTTYPCTDFVIGIAGLQAGYLAWKNFSERRTHLTDHDVQQAFNESTLGKHGLLREEQVTIAMQSYDLIASVLGRQFEEVPAIIRSFFPENHMVLVPAGSLLKNCIDFLMRDVFDKRFGEALSELEKISRELFSMHVIFSLSLSNEERRAIYSRAPKGQSAMKLQF